MSKPLEPGDEIHCLHCGRWNPLVLRNDVSTLYADDMLFWQCGKSSGFYYALRRTARRHQSIRDEPQRQQTKRLMLRVYHGGTPILTAFNSQRTPR